VSSTVDLQEMLAAIRGSGEVPLAIISYHPTTDSFKAALFTDLQPEEANALLKKLGMGIVWEGTNYTDKK
jgi:hypothetical protein